jgi:GAF domain-containing protein
MSVPLREGNRLNAVLTLVAFHDTRDWPEALVARLSAVGHVFVQALARSRADLELRDALAEVRALKERLADENAYLQTEVKRSLTQ